MENLISNTEFVKNFFTKQIPNGSMKKYSLIYCLSLNFLLDMEPQKSGTLKILPQPLFLAHSPVPPFMFPPRRMCCNLRKT